MSRRSVIIIVSVLLALCVAAAVVYVVVCLPDKLVTPPDTPVVDGESESDVLQPQVVEEPDSSHSTNNIIVFEDEFTADPMMVGKWQNTENPGWYQVFYDDYDDENFFWGKEWDESDDVMEEDLRYHGNGWFRWRKDGKSLLEVAVQDQHSGDIPHEYTIRRISDDVLELEEKDARHRIFLFNKIE